MEMNEFVHVNPNPQLNYIQLEMIMTQVLSGETIELEDSDMTCQVWNYARMFYQINLKQNGNLLKKA